MSIPETSPAPARRPAVLITGASRGIGRAVADELAGDHRLILGGRDAAALAELAASYPEAEPFAVDVTDYPAVGDAVAALDLPDGLSAVVHSAGVLVGGTTEEMAVSEWNRSMEVNVTAVVELTRLLLPALRKARGTVVALNSGSGFNSIGGRGAYCASKFALRAFTDALRLEERRHGVRVSSVHAGRVDTDMQHELRGMEDGPYEIEKYLEPTSVASAVALAIRATDEASMDVISVRPRMG
ncbi:SDR family oxidoreductase [Brachybacterium kimchii]|uniref:SDR family oxidoreductase n=1 Tax=Brachybacterium kimchii TaxID=2942909 RepID=A0ABY4NDD5_9MICO|nr:SDR family oxidoreductase [Brachybacterium kimchii]UQN31585.1 SDR family oxidoreductase [Brachybacterium kimchii]